MVAEEYRKLRHLHHRRYALQRKFIRKWEELKMRREWGEDYSSDVTQELMQNQHSRMQALLEKELELKSQLGMEPQFIRKPRKLKTR